MRRWGWAAVAVVAFSVAQGAAAQGESASVATTAELAQVCRMEDRAFCYGYVNGAGQFYQAMVNDADADVEPFVCPGREVSEAEAVTTFLDWVDAHPDAASEPAIDGLFRAWVAAFPCE
ncbi:MAG: Rap1a/Tai family immunity protein [Alphaproteobacteria bacterium]